MSARGTHVFAGTHVCGGGGSNIELVERSLNRGAPVIAAALFAWLPILLDCDHSLVVLVVLVVLVLVVLENEEL